ncbi:helix-turn-helix transcriptional regulator [Streptantibioticus parmotrematis]|uniref:helix-turn-helix domain-containing protein n=1 Tax=Streptantibioticus parmotrematis TaxID=2873249 RepID=UPI0033E3FFED
MHEPGPDRCLSCEEPLERGTRGRPKKYCSEACRQAGYRLRKTAGQPLGASPMDQRSLGRGLPPTAVDDQINEIARDMLEELKHLLRTLAGSDADIPPHDGLHRAVQLGTQLDGLTAGLVVRARHHRVTWAAIGQILHIGEDTARHRYSAARTRKALDTVTRPAPSLPALTHDDVSTNRTAPPEDPPTPPARTASNRFAPVLSMLVRATGLPNSTISARVGISASYLSRLLSGERMPNWKLAEKLARACGADPVILRQVWESERLADRDEHPAAAPPTPDDLNATDACTQLTASLRTLHIRAGRPASHIIATTTHWRLSSEQVDALLEGEDTDWERTKTLVHILGGDISYFESLHQAVPQPAPTTPPPPANPHFRILAPAPRAEGSWPTTPHGLPILLPPSSHQDHQAPPASWPTLRGPLGRPVQVEGADSHGGLRSRPS